MTLPSTNHAAVGTALERAFDQAEAEAVAFMRTVAVQALADAQRLSPVDTGLYRASHNLSISPAAIAYAPAGERGGDPSGLSSVAAARSIPDGGLTIFLWNSQIYAWPLEDGHSLQAPQGIYRIVRAIAATRLASGGGVR